MLRTVGFTLLGAVVGGFAASWIKDTTWVQTNVTSAALKDALPVAGIVTGAMVGYGFAHGKSGG